MNFLLIIFLVIKSSISLNRVDEINKLFKSAENSFNSKDYNQSIENYRILIDSFQLSDEKIFLNLAHSYLLSNDTLKAIENYNYASLTENNKIQSIALQQLGNINERKNRFDEALEYYKRSIISDNSNNDSKFNYELVKKKIDMNQKNNKDQKPNQNNKSENQKENKKKDQSSQKEKAENTDKNEREKDKNNQNQKGKGEEKEESIEQKLKQINMTKKKAEMILDALNNNEFQYIQQLKRKPSKKQNKNKPDW